MHHASCAIPPLDPEMVQLGEVTLKVLASPSTALILEGWSRWSSARWNKIKVSGRLSVKTVPTRAYLELVSACVVHVHGSGVWGAWSAL